MAKAKTQYTRTYSNLRGVELGVSGSEVSRNRLAYAENMYRDWDGEDSSILESIPGYRRIATLGGRVHSLILQRISKTKEYLLVHAGTGLYRLNIGERDHYVPSEPIATLEDRTCAHFSHGGSVYILSGYSIIKISAEGAVSRLGSEESPPYHPILELNGEPYEQKNLLSDTWRVKFLLARPDEYSFGTYGLSYKILDREDKTCAVSGISRAFSGDVYVPAYTEIGGETYRVTEIAASAFYFCSGVTAIYISEGVEIIGESAFRYCTGAKKIVVPNSVSAIGSSAFSGCSALEELYLGAGIYKLGDSLFLECKPDMVIHYALGEAQFELISGFDAAAEFTKSWNSPYGGCALRLPMPDGCSKVLSVEEDGEAREFEAKASPTVTDVLVHSMSTWEKPHEIIITAKSSVSLYSFGSGTVSVLGTRAITDCTIAEVFDNRVFLSGNPMLPGVVFYSALDREGEDNPLYFGELSYFTDGIGGYTTTALLPVAGSLAVFKSGDDGSGCIFYHTPENTGDDYMPRIYPRSGAHSGISAIGSAISFMDDPVFMASGGLYALDKQSINYERSVVCRSHNVNHDLQKTDPTSVRLTEWCGYLVLLSKGKIFLADSRSTFRHKTGAIEYDWFILNGIGSYKDDREVWRFDTAEYGDILAHPSEDEIYDGVVYSHGESDNVHYYGLVDGKKYSLYRTGERAGGTFSPATAALGVGKLLFFGTDSGALMVFNNDKRGIPPEEIRSAADFDYDEYEEVMGTRIHPYFYSFDGHAVRYAVKTAYDDCEIPHLTKSTVKHSLVLRCKCTSSATVRCEVGTESSDYSEVTSFPGGKISFAEMDLASLSLSPADYHTLPIAEKEKRWIEKQITVYSEGYASPIGISAIAYRYTIEGKVKRT